MGRFKEFLEAMDDYRLGVGNYYEPAVGPAKRWLDSQEIGYGTDNPRLVWNGQRDMNLQNWTKSKTRPAIDNKPPGIWYGVGRSWLDSSPSGGYRVTNQKGSTIHEIKPNPDTMLYIRTPQQFLEFEKKYGVYVDGNKEPFPEEELRKDYIERGLAKNVIDELMGLHLVIDWMKVAHDYAGIEIAPYQDQFRRHEWYSTWDCASGCIWNKKGILDYKTRATWDDRAQHGKYLGDFVEPGWEPPAPKPPPAPQSIKASLPGSQSDSGIKVGDRVRYTSKRGRTAVYPVAKISPNGTLFLKTGYSGKLFPALARNVTLVKGF